MAERRMFAKTVVLSDAFLDMPPSARCLYFAYGMLADDDGFVNNPKSVMRQCGSTDEDIQQLVDGGYIIKFDSGVIAITAWKVNNLIKNDRYVPTACTKEKKMLKTTDSGFYVESTYGSESEEKSDCYVEMTYGSDNSAKSASPVPIPESSCIHSGSTTGTEVEPKWNHFGTNTDPNWIQSGTKVEPKWNQSGTKLEPQDSIGKYSIVQDNKRQNAPTGAGACTREGEKRTYFTPPTIEEVLEYCRSRNNNVDPEQFYDFYESKGWMIGKNRMKDWKAAVRTWERDRNRASQGAKTNEGSFDTDDFFQAALQRSMFDLSEGGEIQQ